MTKAQGRRSKKLEGYYKRQFDRTTANKARRVARVTRRKKSMAQTPETKARLLGLKRAKSKERQRQKAIRSAIAEAHRQERERRAA